MWDGWLRDTTQLITVLGATLGPITVMLLNARSRREEWKRERTASKEDKQKAWFREDHLAALLEARALYEEIAHAFDALTFARLVELNTKGSQTENEGQLSVLIRHIATMRYVGSTESINAFHSLLQAIQEGDDPDPVPEREAYFEATTTHLKQLREAARPVDAPPSPTES